MRTYAVAAGLALVLVTAAAGVLAGRLLSPVRTLRETADEISETDLSRRIPEVGNDDLTDLTRTFNAMLARLERAFAGQRAFLDDAGHELRTPLTILQGHLELMDSRDLEDVERTRELLLDEVDRMARLVEDMILLTKADRPGFLTTRPLVVASLVDSVLSKAKGLAARDWQIDGSAPGLVEADEQRVTQALVQLAHNAVKHTSDGDTVALGSADNGDGTVRLWVRDCGPGVPDSEKDAIFRRFSRGSEAPAHDGVGLGLSIVTAIAQAHGGVAHVEDAEPSGARFVIVLPRTRKEPTWPAS
jgi:signal transduction histidine kinase